MKKRLLMLMLASTLAFSTCAMTGCGEDSSKSSSDKKDKDAEDDDADDDEEAAPKKRAKKDESEEEDAASLRKNNKKDVDLKSETSDKDNGKSGSDTTVSAYTLEDYLIDTNQLDDMKEAMGDDLYFEIEGNDMYFSMTLDDDGLNNDEIEEYSEYMAEYMGNILEEQFEDILDEVHDESGITDPFSVTFVMYGETTGIVIWQDTYVK